MCTGPSMASSLSVSGDGSGHPRCMAWRTRSGRPSTRRAVGSAIGGRTGGAATRRGWCPWSRLPGHLRRADVGGSLRRPACL